MDFLNHIRIMILICMIILPAAAQAETCKMVFTDKAPFYVSSVTKNTAENFKLKDGESSQVTGVGRKTGSKSDEISSEFLFFGPAKKKSYRLLTRGSLVKTEVDFLPSTGSQALIKVEVLKANPIYNKFSVNAKMQSKDGDTGYIPLKSVERAQDNHILIAKEDAPLFPFAGLSGVSIPAGSALKPAMVAGRYKAMDCGAAGISYLFLMFDPRENSFGKSVEIRADQISCQDFSITEYENFSSLLKLQKTLEKLYGEKISVSQLEFNEWGYVRLPMERKNLSRDVVYAAYDKSFVHYQGGDPVGTDDWMLPNAACGFMRLIREWQTICSNPEKCIVQMGDAAFFTPGKKSGTSQDPLGHHSHHSGKCIDVRPFRKDGALKPLNISEDKKEYDAETTYRFVKFLIDRGASPIYFNDPKIYRDAKIGERKQCTSDEESNADIGKKVQSCSGHDNHIHFCLEPDRVRGCE